MENLGSEVEQLARIIARQISVMPELAYADILYHPQYHYHSYTKHGGSKSLREWIVLCEEERRPVKNRKSLR